MASYEHTTTLQSNLNWGETFKMTVKAPAIADRIFKTWDDANKYIHDRGNSAIAGLNLSVIDDGDRNGVYFIDSIRRSEGYVDDFGNVYHAGEKELVMVQLASGGGKFNYSGIQIGTGEQMNVWTGTLEEFNQITPDEHTVYFIDGGGYKSKKNWFYVQSSNTEPETATVYEYGAGGITIEVSRDGFVWEELCTTESGGEYPIALQPGEKVYMRSKTDYWGETGINGVSKVGGNILSLLYGADFDDSQRTLPEGSTRSFEFVFYETGVKDASNLVIDIEEVSEAALYNLFGRCPQLKTPPQIRIDKVGEGGCAEMFFECTSLEYAPALTATEVGYGGYSNMFGRCTSLVSAPTVAADTIGENGCQYMFAGCTSLVSAPTLTATKVGQKGYMEMFSHCTSLVSAPVIEVTELGISGCFSMFLNCTSITNVSSLKATRLNQYCYSYMFLGCTALVDMPEIMAEVTDTYSCYHMFDSCTSLKNVTDLLSETISPHCYSHMFRGCTSLIDAPGNGATSILNHGCEGMFVGCTSLQNVPDFSFTDIDSYGCNYMFSGCTSLVNMPDIPCMVTAKRCYNSMFSGCTSLVRSTALYAQNLADFCCSSMFRGCTSLVGGPKILAVTVGQGAMELMFEGCTSMVTPPSLYSVEEIGQEGCYMMFSGCTSLIRSALMNPTGLILGPNGCKSMYQGCTSLTIANPVRFTNGVVDNCDEMFKDCANLCMVTNLTTYTAAQPWRAEYRWLEGVATNGVFVKTDNTSWVRSTSAIPIGWVEIGESNLTRGDIMYYKTNDGNIMTPNESKFADAAGNPVSITSNVIDENGIGVINFSAPVGRITGAAFNRKSNLTEVWLPYTVVDTGQGTFNDCTNLKMIWIWENVEVIGATFNGLTSLQKVYVHATEPPVLSVNQANNLKNYGASVYVPHESLRLYTEADNWSTIADQIVGM